MKPNEKECVLIIEFTPKRQTCCSLCSNCQANGYEVEPYDIESGTKAAFQNVTIQSLYAFLLLYINYLKICKVTNQCINYKSDAWLLFDFVKNKHWQRFKVEHTLYIFCIEALWYTILCSNTKQLSVLEGNQIHWLFM